MKLLKEPTTYVVMILIFLVYTAINEKSEKLRRILKNEVSKQNWLRVDSLLQDDDFVDYVESGNERRRLRLINSMKYSEDALFIFDKILHNKYPINFEIRGREIALSLIARENYKSKYFSDLLSIASEFGQEGEINEKLIDVYLNSLNDSMVNKNSFKQIKLMLNELNVTDESFYEYLVPFRNKLTSKDITELIDNEEIIKNKFWNATINESFPYRYSLYKELKIKAVTKADISKLAEKFEASATYSLKSCQSSIPKNDDQIKKVMNRIIVKKGKENDANSFYLKKKREIEEYEDVKEKYFLTGGYIIAELSRSSYEAMIHGKRAILYTSYMNYTSRGNFSTYVYKGISKQITTVNGFTQTWNTYHQAPKSAVEALESHRWDDYSRLKKAKNKVYRIKTDLRKDCLKLSRLILKT